MKDYTLKAVSVTFDITTLLDKIVTTQIPAIATEKNVIVIPTIAYEILKKEIKNGKDNYTYVNAFLEIIKTLYQFDGEEIRKQILQSISRDYKSILETIRPIISKTDYPTFDGESKNHSTIHYMRSYADLTFVNLVNTSELNVTEIDFDYDGLKDTPLNNDMFINTLMKTKLDARSAIAAEFTYVNSQEFIDNNNDKNKYVVFIKRVNAILNFITYRYARKAEKVDRVYSSFTALSKVARKYLTINNKPFIEIDIKNCQPLLLLILACEQGIELDNNYINDVVDGCFYEELMYRTIELGYNSEFIYDKKKSKLKELEFNTNNKNINRDNIKTLCYNDIFFANKHKNTNLVKGFKSLYPKTYDALLSLSTETTLAYLLQNLEADVVLNIVPNSPYFTVHDAIYISRTTEVQNVMKEIEKTIYNRTGGLVKSIKFGEIKENKIIILDELNNDKNIEVLNIKERAPHSAKTFKMNTFIKLIEQGLDQEDIMNILKITNRTYFRYKKQLIESI